MTVVILAKKIRFAVISRFENHFHKNHLLEFIIEFNLVSSECFHLHFFTVMEIEQKELNVTALCTKAQIFCTKSN